MDHSSPQSRPEYLRSVADRLRGIANGLRYDFRRADQLRAPARVHDCADRARFFALFTAISPPAASGAGIRNRSGSDRLRRQSKRAELVCMEFYPRKLGGVIKE